MKRNSIEKLAKEKGLPLQERQGILYLGELGLYYRTIDEKGRPCLETNPENFPKSCNKAYIEDSLSVKCKDLGYIKKVNWQQFQDSTFVIADIETTGFSPDKGGRIIEIGAVKIDETGNVIDKFSEFINPRMRISAKITELTSITNEMVKDAPFESEVLPRFCQFFKGSTIVFHNAVFDWDRFIVPGLQHCGIKVPENYPCLDTKLISRECFPDESKHDLHTLCDRVGVVVENHHRAIADAEMTANAFMRLREKCKDKWKELPKTRWINANTQTSKPNIRITSVNYWEKRKVRSQELIHQRHYVRFYYNQMGGSCFYDWLNKEWKIQEFHGSLNFQEIEFAVLKFLNLSSMEEFHEYQNKRPA